MRKYFNRKTAEVAFVLVTITFFAFVKMPVDFKSGDGNAYVYMAQEILHGQLPYRDFFLADPPFFVLAIALLKFIFGSNLIIFQYVPIVLESAAAFFLYLLLKERKNPFAAAAAAVYLFSFSILATSIYFTGVQVVTLLMILALFAHEKQKHFLAGICWALACLAKLYATPAFLGYIGWLAYKKEKKAVWRAIAGSAAAGAVFVLPFAALSLSNFFDYTFLHHLRRPPGIAKMVTFGLFAKTGWFLIILGAAGLAIKKTRAFAVPAALSLAFLIFFKDLYFLYTNILVPFLVIGAVSLAERINEWPSSEKKPALLILLSVYLAFTIQTIAVYERDYIKQGYFGNAPEIAEYVKTLPPGDLYGAHDKAPLIALLADRKIFKNHIDTNTQVFAARTADLNSISQTAAEQGVYLIAGIVDLPQYGIKEQGFEGYFSREVFDRYCSPLKKFEHSASESVDNFIGVYFCKKSN